MPLTADPYVINLPAAAHEAAACRAQLLARRRQGLPSAARLLPDTAPTEESLRTIFEFLQYVDLCITDTAALRLLFPALPTDRAAQTEKLLRRFALGGIVLTDQHYACLRTAVAESLFVRLRPICAKYTL